MSNNKPLRRGVDGVCTRSTCECEREGLGDQCVWLKPADRRPAPGCRTPEGCRENGCLGWCDEHRPDPTLKPDIAALQKRMAEDPGFAAQVTGDRPPTPVGWSDTDWLKHLEEVRQNEAAYVKGPLPERGWD